MEFLDKNWLKKHLEDIEKKADKRYTPELNVELPLSEIFEGLGRTEAFYATIQSHYGKLLKRFRSTTSIYSNKRIQRTYDAYAKNVRELLDILGKLKKYDTEQIPWNKIHSLAIEAQGFSWKLYDQVKKEKEKPDNRRLLRPEDPHRYPTTNADILSFDLHSLSDAQVELRFFIDFSKGTSAAISNKPFLMINGSAGSGKTHLLCDLVKHRIDKGYAPSILSFGEFFEGNDDIWVKMTKQLGRDSAGLNKEKILKELNRKGKSANGRSILMIDALNESRPLSFWHRKLNGLIDDIRDYPNIALVITIRSGFERDVVSEKVSKLFIHTEHRGFEFQEWEAVTRFFKEFSLPLPEIPLLTPEFQNPLFLLLFCKAFENTASKASKKSFKGHEGATYIFERYVDSVALKIETKFKIDHGQGKNIWDTVIEKIAEEMVGQNVDRLTEAEILKLINKAHPDLGAANLLNECEKSLLLVKVQHYVSEKNVSEGFDYRFPFQRFSDHLIGRFLFKEYEREFGKTNKNIETATKFFSPRRKLGKFLRHGINRGIIEALFIQCPEQLRGIEFFEVAPYISSYIATDSFVQSVIWRKPSAFSADLKKPIEFINRNVLASSNGNSAILNAFLSVSVVPAHPFNAEFLHKHLMKKEMPDRDAWWSVFLHDEYENKDAVDRLLKWSWSNQDVSHLSDESVFLAITILSWFLTTPNRFVRDKATKGLVHLMQNRLHLITTLFEKFESVDDPYVTERLLAAAYGAVLRNKEDFKNIKSIATYTYNKFFKDNRPPVHALIRDYARGIIEVAKLNKIKFRYSIKNTEPPYQSTWPTRIPSGKTLKKKYYPEDFFANRTKERGYLDIWSSINYDLGSLGDFGNYEINSHLGHWSGRKLNRPEANRKELYEEFKKGLTRREANLLGKATNPFFGIDFGKLMTSIRYIDPSKNEEPDEDEKEERKRKIQEEGERRNLLIKFKESLALKKRKYFESEIEPFLDERGSINDPHERFDTSLAQRWIFNRVVQLGFDPKIHGSFDSRVNRYGGNGRSNHKAERIGKKYQWIALHEFTALVADHFEFTGRYWDGRIAKYLGAWNPYTRDIDPTLLMQNDEKIKAEASFDAWKKGPGHYDGWLRERGDRKWLQKTTDLPDPKGIIDITDDNGKDWLALKGIFVWQQGTPPNREKYDYPARELFYLMKSFIVKKKDTKAITKWLLDKGWGNWLPESNNWYEAWIGEFPNLPSFEDIRGDHNIWTSANEREDEIKRIKLVVTDDAYLNEFTLDCSRDESISMMIPSKFLMNNMKLKHPELDGRFRDKDGNVVIYATSVSEENNPSALIANKKSLLDFLDKNDYEIFWTLLGEKQFMGGSMSGRDKHIGQQKITGIYFFDGNNKLKGVTKTNFEEPTKIPRRRKRR